MGTLNDMIYLPRPREIREAGGGFVPRRDTRILLWGKPAAILPAARRLQEAGSRSLGMRWPIAAGLDAGGAGSAGAIRLRLGRGDFSAQGYKTKIDANGIDITAADEAGLAYGVATLTQIIRQCQGRVPAGEIVDHPDFAVRGVMLDISRDKVPTMETLYSLVDLLAEMKINHFELYTEHTFAYQGHREVWADASPLTGEEILLLDAYCRARFIDLTPNQNSFGHLHRWLSLPRYAALAECPDGFAWPWGGRSNVPFSLDPSNPGSLALLDQLYAELLPHFGSRLFNVGCDETFDLGQGKNRELCERRGKGRVYLDFLLQIHRRVSGHGRTMLYWGDIIVQHADLVPELPRDAVALEWGYEHDHPFEEHGALFQAAGVPWWVCPGTSSWNAVAGRTRNCLENLRAAARAGLAHGATGFLNTDWGDNGHWQVLPVSWLGFAAGAGLSWCHAASAESDFRAELDMHAFRDRAGIMGDLASDLGNVYALAGERIHNRSPLFEILVMADDAAVPAGASAAALTQTRQAIENAAGSLDAARMDRPDAGLIRDEYANTARLLTYACDRGAALGAGAWEAFRDSPSARETLRGIIGEYRRLWVTRNRIGGLADSVRGLERLLPARLA